MALNTAEARANDAGTLADPDADTDTDTASAPRRTELRWPRHHLLRVDPVAPQLPLKSPSIDSQRGGCLRDVAACLSQDPFDVIAFDVGQARATGLA